ncbi:hypothetical protein K438DRAFT_1831553 [Mycena galopus ATCC 62051]|nr:hypothetical protein K438DRAFT_1831553 [Mycena galopus ATCC 62051]
MLVVHAVARVTYPNSPRTHARRSSHAPVVDAYSLRTYASPAQPPRASTSAAYARSPRMHLAARTHPSWTPTPCAPTPAPRSLLAQAHPPRTLAPRACTSLLAHIRRTSRTYPSCTPTPRAPTPAPHKRIRRVRSLPAHARPSHLAPTRPVRIPPVHLRQPRAASSRRQIRRVRSLPASTLVARIHARVRPLPTHMSPTHARRARRRTRHVPQLPTHARPSLLARTRRGRLLPAHLRQPRAAFSRKHIRRVRSLPAHASSIRSSSPTRRLIPTAPPRARSHTALSLRRPGCLPSIVSVPAHAPHPRLHHVAHAYLALLPHSLVLPRSVSPLVPPPASLPFALHIRLCARRVQPN